MFFNIKKLLSNPMALFVYSIIGKWYVMVTVAAIVVTFWVFKGLEQSGALAATKNVVTEALQQTKAVARYCTPKITNPKLFWDCLDNPPKYQPSPEEDAIEKLDTETKEATPTQSTDPYNY